LTKSDETELLNKVLDKLTTNGNWTYFDFSDRTAAIRLQEETIKYTLSSMKELKIEKILED